MGVKRTSSVSATAPWDGSSRASTSKNGSTRLTLDTPTPEAAIEKADAFGRKVAAEDGVQYLTYWMAWGVFQIAEHSFWRTSTLIDVRSAEEFEVWSCSWLLVVSREARLLRRSDNADRREGGSHSIFLRWRCPGLGYSFPLQADWATPMFTSLKEARRLGRPSRIRAGQPGSCLHCPRSVGSRPAQQLNPLTSRPGIASKLMELLRTAVALFVGTSAEFAQGTPTRHSMGAPWLS